MKYKMVVFDLDGTILNTIEDLRNAVNYSLSSFGLSSIDINQTKTFLGHGIRFLMQKASNNHPEDIKLLNAFKTYYYEHYNDFTKPYDGIREVLDFCKENGIKIGVLTNKVEEVAVKLCDAHFNKDFLFVYGDIEGRKRKPDPEMLIKIMNEYNITNEQILYVGDSEVDYDTALNAKCDICLCGYGFRDKDELTARYGNIVVNEAREIINFIK